MTHAVMKHLLLLLLPEVEAVLIIARKLLQLLLLLLEEEAVLIIALKILQSPTAAEEKLLRVWKCNCASRNNSMNVANY